ncbi:hypothetical protein YPPY72_3897, partial [Yersinia pestis PY-72]
MRMIAVCQG